MIRTSAVQSPEIHTAVAATQHDSSEPIVTAEYLHCLYIDSFEGLGRLTGTVHIELDPTVLPVVPAPRECPIHLRMDLEKELDGLQKLGVIKNG